MRPCRWLTFFLAGSAACGAVDADVEAGDSAVQVFDASGSEDAGRQSERDADATLRDVEAGSDAGLALADAASISEASVDAGQVVIVRPQCMDSDAPYNPSAPGTALDSFGTKGYVIAGGVRTEDRCDAMGNLVEAECAKQFGCSKGGACAPSWMPTGYATTSQHDCLGMCSEGVCSLPCPRNGESLTLLAGDSPDQVRLVTASLSLQCPRSTGCTSAGALGTRQTLTSVSPRPACNDILAWQFSSIMLSDGCLYLGCRIERRPP